MNRHTWVVTWPAPFYNAEDDEWFDFSVPGSQLAPGWRWEWTVHYPVSYVGFVKMPPPKIVVASDLYAVTWRMEADSDSWSAMPDSDQQAHMGVEFD